MAETHKDDIYDKLQHIRATFVQPNMRSSPFLGAFGDATFGSDSLPGRLLKGYGGDGGFAAKYGASVVAAPTNAQLAAVKYRDPTSASAAYAALSAAGAGGVPQLLPGNRYVDLNLANLLTDPAAPPKLGEDLDKVALMYALLDDANYATFAQKGASLRLAKYTAPGAPRAYTLNATTGAYTEGGNPATRLDALIADLTGSALATTADVPIGRDAAPGRNVVTARTTDAPPTGVADVVVAIGPANAASSFDTIARPIALPAPAETAGTTATYTVTGQVKLVAAAGTIPAGTATPFAVLLRRGDTMARLGEVTPTTAGWTSFSFATGTLTAADAPLQLVLVYRHNKTWTKVLLTDLRVVATTALGASDGAAEIFTSETDLFVVRRLLLLYVLMGNFYVAMAAYDRMYGAGATTEPAAARRLLSLTYQAISELNRNTNRAGELGDQSDSVRYVSESVNARIQDFQRMGAEINRLGDETTQRKVALRDDLVRMDTTASVRQRSARYAIATIVLVCVVLAALALVFALPSSPLVKVAGTAATLLLALVINLAIRKLYDGNVPEPEPEAFTDPVGARVYNLPDFPGGLSAANKAQILQYYENAFRKEVSEYLSNTVYLALLLKSHQAYGNVNFSMEKEQRFYADAVGQMDVQGTKVRNTTGLLRLDQITERARLTLALSVLIIVTSAAFAAAALRLRYPALVAPVLIAAAVALAIALFLYIMDTNARVRTKGEQRYWQQPDLRTI